MFTMGHVGAGGSAAVLESALALVALQSTLQECQVEMAKMNADAANVTAQASANATIASGQAQSDQTKADATAAWAAMGASVGQGAFSLGAFGLTLHTQLGANMQLNNLDGINRKMNLTTPSEAAVATVATPDAELNTRIANYKSGDFGDVTNFEGDIAVLKGNGSTADLRTISEAISERKAQISRSIDSFNLNMRTYGDFVSALSTAIKSGVEADQASNKAAAQIAAAQQQALSSVTQAAAQQMTQNMNTATGQIASLKQTIDSELQAVYNALRALSSPG